MELDLFSDLSGLDVGFPDTGDEAGGDVGVDAAGNGDKRDDGEGDEADLPDVGESDDEAADESADVVHEIANLRQSLRISSIMSQT